MEVPLLTQVTEKRYEIALTIRKYQRQIYILMYCLKKSTHKSHSKSLQGVVGEAWPRLPHPCACAACITGWYCLLIFTAIG